MILLKKTYSLYSFFKILFNSMSMTSFYPGPLDIHRPIFTHGFYFSSFLPLLTEGVVFNSEK